MAYFTSCLAILFVTFIPIKSTTIPELCKLFCGGTTEQCKEYLIIENDEAAPEAAISMEDECEPKIHQAEININNLKATINDLTNTIESLNKTVQLMSGQLEEACRFLFEAVRSGDVKTVKNLFKFTKDSCTTNDEFRETPLLYAARYGLVEVVLVLLEGGANVSEADALEQSALFYAAWYRHLDVCRLLLERGANVNQPNKWKFTPLHSAVWGGNWSILKLLVERGADVTLRNFHGQTASGFARLWKKDEFANWLDSTAELKDS